jgi:hypothetical protein
VAWAKRQIQEPDTDHVLYLCRLMRLLEIFHSGHTTDRPGVKFHLVNAAMVSGLAVAGGDANDGLRQRHAGDVYAGRLWSARGDG